jgi:hypothetical protein
MINKIQNWQEATGPCPLCGQLPTWWNDIPLRAYCDGTEEVPHVAMTVVVPWPESPYLNADDRHPVGWITEDEMQRWLAKEMDRVSRWDSDDTKATGAAHPVQGPITHQAPGRRSSSSTE